MFDIQIGSGGRLRRQPNRAKLPQLFTDRRRMYCPAPDLKPLVRLIAAFQTSKGWPAPKIVASLEEMFATLAFRARIHAIHRTACRF
jgi:hypothetical protein